MNEGKIDVDQLVGKNEGHKSSNWIHADFHDRYKAFRIDGIIIGLINFPLVLLAGYVLLPDIFLFSLIVILIIILDDFLYFFILESLGNTPGKEFVGIKVIDGYEESITWKRSLLRNSERLIWGIPFLGQVFAYLSTNSIKNKNRRFGDDWADTYVIVEEETIAKTRVAKGSHLI